MGLETLQKTTIGGVLQAKLKFYPKQCPTLPVSINRFTWLPFLTPLLCWLQLFHVVWPNTAVHNHPPGSDAACGTGGRHPPALVDHINFTHHFKFAKMWTRSRQPRHCANQVCLNIKCYLHLRMWWSLWWSLWSMYRYSDKKNWPVLEIFVAHSSHWL